VGHLSKFWPALAVSLPDPLFPLGQIRPIWAGVCKTNSTSNWQHSSAGGHLTYTQGVAATTYEDSISFSNLCRACHLLRFLWGRRNTEQLYNG
jgi:hypothetical protein